MKQTVGLAENGTKEISDQMKALNTTLQTLSTEIAQAVGSLKTFEDLFLKFQPILLKLFEPKPAAKTDDIGSVLEGKTP